jgi:hypothetical protein
MYFPKSKSETPIEMPVPDPDIQILETNPVVETSLSLFDMAGSPPVPTKAPAVNESRDKAEVLNQENKLIADTTPLPINPSQSVKHVNKIASFWRKLIDAFR